MHSHPPSGSPAPCRSPIRWAGGKQRLLSAIRKHLPDGKRLIEPFLGAGSVFFGTSYPEAVLGDANLDLIALWTAVRERPGELAARASTFYVEENRNDEAYRRIRDEYNQAPDSFERAVRFMYLNRFGFNGIYRVNRKGEVNVPYGKPKVLPLFPYDRVAAASEKLQVATLQSGGYAIAMAFAGMGDVVYCDPPYSDLADARSFTSYTADGFTAADHRRLVDEALAARERGATVVISDHDTEETRTLYRAFEITSITASRTVAASASNRGSVMELLAIARPQSARVHR